MSGANIAGLVVLGVVVVGGLAYVVTRGSSRPQPPGGLAQQGVSLQQQYPQAQTQQNNTASDFATVLGALGGLAQTGVGIYNQVNDN